MQAKRSHKRAYGTGSVTAKGGSWQGVWWVDGKRVKRSLGRIRQAGSMRGLTRKQAETRLRELMLEYKPPNSGDVVLFSEAGELHINRLEAMGRQQRTIEAYRSYKRVHLDPELGTRPVDSITPQDLDRLQQKLLRKVTPTGERVSAKSVLNWMSLVHGILAFSLKQEWVPANVADAVDRPKVDDEEEIHFLNHAQLEALLGVCADDETGRLERTLYLVAAMTGLRQGELLGLRWRHVDWAAARVRVEKTKSRKLRSVPLSERAARELELHFQRSAYQGDDDLVFAHPETGNRLDRSRVLKRFKARLKQGKIGRFEERKDKEGGVRQAPVLTFHDLRHTFGTTCAAAGIPLRTIMEWMGHKDIKTTMIYSHYAPSDQEAELIERAFEPKSITHADDLLGEAGGQKGDNPESATPNTDQLRSTAPGTNQAASN
jgi:integrase